MTTDQAARVQQADGGDTESRYERAIRLVDTAVFPAMLVALGLFEMFTEQSSLGAVLILIAVLWVRQHD